MDKTSWTYSITGRSLKNRGRYPYGNVFYLLLGFCYYDVFGYIIKFVWSKEKHLISYFLS